MRRLAALASSPIRDELIAASLKPLKDAGDLSGLYAIRDELIAASLKLCGCPETRSLLIPIRDELIAASLKQERGR